MSDLIINPSFIAQRFGFTKKYARDYKVTPVRKKLGRKHITYQEYCTFHELPIL